MRQSRKIIKNIFSLTVAEASSKGIVFIYSAYLARVIMPEGFGILGFATAFLTYFILFVNLGFNTVGTREIAKSHSNTNKYVNSIIGIRLLFAIIAYAVLYFSVLALDKPLIVKYIIWISGINLFSNAILLDWVYHGNERMEFLGLRQVITSSLNLIGIILLVHSKSDIILAMVVTVASTFLNSLWMLLLYIKMYGKIKLEFDVKFLKELFKSSIPLTFSNFFVVILNTLNIIVLGLFRTDQEVGYFKAAYQILLLTIVPTIIIQNAFFPLISRSDSMEEKQKVMKKFFLLIFLIGSIVSVGFFTFADLLTMTIFGKLYHPTTDLVRILMITSVIVYINIGTNVALVGWKKEKLVMYAIVVGGIVNIILNFLLIPAYGATGAAWAGVVSELTVGIGLTYHFYKLIRKIYFFDGFKLVLFAVLSCFAGYLLMSNNIHPIISGIVSIIIFILINFLFKTITINEIKGYFAK